MKTTMKTKKWKGVCSACGVNVTRKQNPGPHRAKCTQCQKAKLAKATLEWARRHPEAIKAYVNNWNEDRMSETKPSAKAHSQRYTEREDAYIMKNAGRKTYLEMALKLGRTWFAIKGRLQVLRARQANT